MEGTLGTCKRGGQKSMHPANCAIWKSICNMMRHACVAVAIRRIWRSGAYRRNFFAISSRNVEIHVLEVNTPIWSSGTGEDSHLAKFSKITLRPPGAAKLLNKEEHSYATSFGRGTVLFVRSTVAEVKSAIDFPRECDPAGARLDSTYAQYLGPLTE